MAGGLQELRKRAGHRTAKGFAETMGIPLTTYARYESSPEKIPLAVAWRFADEFGVSIDVVVGREEPAPVEQRGEVQLRYDALAPEYQSSLDDYLGYLTAKNADAAKRRADERQEPEVRDSVGKIMAAYDRTHDEFDCKGMMIRYTEVDMAAVREFEKEVGALS